VSFAKAPNSFDCPLVVVIVVASKFGECPLISCRALLGLVPFENKVPVSIHMAAENKLAPIRKGLLEFLVLKIVGARSVYVADILKRLSGTEFATQEGTLYPLLSKLRREDLVLYEWQESDAGPPRKYYRLTDAGRAQLAALDEYWTLINRTIADLGA
jgi:PadR family transcriptional regulator PadR